MHIIKTVIYAVLIVLSSIFTLHAADLPEIELPEYIISGIEKATRVRGDRLPTSITSAIVSPDAISPSRPELTALSIRSLPSKPSTDRRLKPGYWNAGISGGGFRMFGVNGCLVYAMPKVTRMGTVRLIHSPHRINIGETYGWRVRYGETHTFKGDVSICPRVTYDFNEFNLLDSLDNHRARRGDLKVDLFLSPWSTPVGAFTGYANWDGWRYSSLSDLSGFTSVFNLKHNLSLATGKLESDVFFGLENVKEDDDNLRLTHLTTGYLFQPHPDLLIGGGFSVYTGEDAAGEQRQGILPHLKAQTRLPIGGTLSLSYNPTARYTKSGTTLTKWQVLDTTARGNITEAINNLALLYRRSLDSNIELRIGGFLTRTRHVIFAIPDTCGGWQPVSRRLNSSGFQITGDYIINHLTSVQLHARYERARTVGIGSGDSAPQISPISAGASGTVPLGVIKLKTELNWSNRAPVDFTNTVRRPKRFIWNASVSKEFKRSITVELGVDNILNDRYYDFPRYDMPPMTVYISAYYKSNWYKD